MMTKKDFVALANTLKRLDIDPGIKEVVCDAIGDVCQASNSNFNRTEWNSYISKCKGDMGQEINKPRFVVEDGCLQLSPDAVFPQSCSEALAMSIEKWETIVDAFKDGIVVYVNGDVETCALCRLYLVNSIEKNCNGCPVREHTGHYYCNGTPYIDFCGAPTLNSAIAELEFLKTLQCRKE